MTNQNESFPRVSDVVSPFEDTSFYDDFSRERGNIVHRAIATYLKGLWVPPMRLHRGYFDSFRRWGDDMIEEVILVEQPLQSLNFGFRGTLDCLAKIRSRGRSIADWKTSASVSNRMKKTWKLRIGGGYTILAEENGYGPIEASFALMLNADGEKAKVIAEGELIDQAFFLRALDLERYFE